MSKEHLLLTAKGCIRSRVVRRIPDGSQASYHAEVKGLPWDAFKGSAEMLRNATIRSGEPPRPSRGRPRKDGTPALPRTATTTGQDAAEDDQAQGAMPGSSKDQQRQPSTDQQDVIEQDMVIDTQAPEVRDDKGKTGEVDKPEQGALRMDDDEDMATSKQLERRSSPDDESECAIFGAAEAGGDDRGDQGRDPQDRSRGEARSGGTGAQFLREHQNSTEYRVDSCFAPGGDQ